MKTQQHVLNTRPKHQSHLLTQLITEIGGDVFDFPLFDIQPIPFKKQASFDFDCMIFLSANAVDCFFLDNSEIKISGNIIAIGSATKLALQKKQIRDVICPNHFSSEGILEMPLLQNINKHSIFIICGENSKSLLSSELIARGAQIKIIICYRRAPVIYDMKTIFSELIDQKINAVIATSFESLRQLLNLFDTPAHRDWLLEKKLCVVTEKMKNEAIHAGFRSIIQASNATDQAIGAALQE